jgi:hypothetical protein
MRSPQVRGFHALMKRVLVLALTAVALGAAACGGDDDEAPASTPSGTSPLTGVHTQLNPTSAVKAAGTTTGAVAPATSGSGGIVLPIDGGEVNTESLAGTVEHGGGLRYSAGGKSAEVTDIVIDTTSKQLTGEVGGSKQAVMDVELGPVNQTGAVIQADITLKLTSGGADALNSALGGDRLSSGMTVANGVIQAKTQQP